MYQTEMIAAYHKNPLGFTNHLKVLDQGEHHHTLHKSFQVVDQCTKCVLSLL